MIRTLLAAGAVLVATPALADTLIYNVDGVTIDEEGEVKRFTSLVFDDDGIITHVLERGEDRPDGIEFAMDGEGQVMLPGLIDAHVHVMDIGFAALTLDLSDTNSLEEALAKVAEFAEANPGRPWILGRGWNQEKWGLGRFPTAAELDAIVSDRPVWLERADNHANWANSVAMEQAGITAETQDPEGGRIIRDTDGNPTGVFIDNASSLVGSFVPAPRPEDRDAAFAMAQQRLLQNGITAVADMGTPVVDWMTFRRSADRGDLRIRIMAYANSPEAMELIGGPGPTPWLYEDRLRLNGIKLYVDGALGSRGATLKEPYSDEPNTRGIPITSPAQLRNRMSRAALDNFQTAVHAIGDAANEDVLLAIEELSTSYKGDRRWRIEHAQIVDVDDLKRFGQHGTIASMQPLHQTSDMFMAEARLGEDRLGGAYAWRSILEVGGRLAFGSDAPVEPADVFAGIAVAISRTDENGRPFGGWRAQEAVSREQALAGFTSNAAYAGFADGRFGRLVVGERADFIFVDRDPMLASPSDIRETEVREVYLAGERVFAR
ncbi:Predicted metal-dependent amidohydrolase with the TIM-barrel fold [Erythrobacter sp. NAP1]|uniref:amidohydrolase n=1 Tax=Erythrobacter sp. NAP1 TaxID=237727 RepID=UPI000068694D|nr:amidohydrolase [Erythrobacter sp. NAP1]EAQ29259.1 Predicted metal-dependent amidohydrolase with the TIM-barrel fold [Erythrobacter sp. NAP1]